MRATELVGAMIRAGGPELQHAMAKVAASAFPRAPTIGTKLPRGPLPANTAAAPARDETRPEAVAAQKTIAPPAP